MVAMAKQKRVIPVVNFQPCRDYVLVEELEPGETASGLVLSEGADMGPPKCFVIAVGEGRPSEWNPAETIPMSCSPGEYCYVLGTLVEVYLEGKLYGLVRDKDIVALAPQG